MRRLTVRIAGVVAVVYMALLASSAAWSRVPIGDQPCPPAETLVLVDTDARILSLCRDGRPEHVYRVAIGRGGSGKQVEGDGRTPLGRYPLAEARASRRYHLFMPVGYPTPDQVRQGYTGSAIGVHGPHVAFAWLGHAIVWSDWTLGCVALGTRGQIRAVASWARENGVRTIAFVPSRAAAQQ
jgi:hypothetical protein